MLHPSITVPLGKIWNFYLIFRKIMWQSAQIFQMPILGWYKFLECPHKTTLLACSRNVKCHKYILINETQIFHMLHKIFKSGINNYHGLNILNNHLISHIKHLKIHEKTMKIRYSKNKQSFKFCYFYFNLLIL